jgi:hypothetical protein
MAGAPTHEPLQIGSELDAVATRPWLRPALVGVGALAACALVAVRDPNQSGSYGFCPFKATTGLDCPGCGMMRASHALFTGDVSRMFDHNLFLPVVLLAAVFGYIRWLRRSVGHEVRPITTPPWLIVSMAVVVFGFWVARNVGGPFEYLASAAS